MKKQLIPIVILILAFISCSKETTETSIKKDSVTGFVQKGPFINGTSITISELNVNLSQTGKSYNTQIVNNQGSFEIENIELSSNYVRLRADGFYYNEILGEQSSSQITLYAISDISDKSNINVNVLSHLEKHRVEYLVSQGQSFADAKNQAQQEVLGIFNFKLDSNQSSEVLDISKSGNNNGALLAASLILQGYRSESEFTELLSNIGADLKEDGLLTDSTLGSQLMNNAIFIDTASVKTNLENRYSELGIDVIIPYFGHYIKEFIDSTDFQISETLIEYPESGLHGLNILALEVTQYEDTIVSLAANLPRGTSLTIKIKQNYSDCLFEIPLQNWIVEYKPETDETILTCSATESNVSCDYKLIYKSGELNIEYFEMNSDVPTRSKTIIK